LAVVFITGIVVMVLLIGAPRNVTVTTTASPQRPPIVVPAAPEPAGGFSLTSADRVVCMSGSKKIANEKVGAIIASGSCVVTLTGCTVTGNPAIVATDQARVLVVGGSIEPSGMVAVIANGNATVELRSGAKLSGQVLEQGNGRVVR
jgi:hypothetical protein